MKACLRPLQKLTSPDTISKAGRTIWTGTVLCLAAVLWYYITPSSVTLSHFREYFMKGQTYIPFKNEACNNNFGLGFKFPNISDLKTKILCTDGGGGLEFPVGTCFYLNVRMNCITLWGALIVLTTMSLQS